MKVRAILRSERNLPNPPFQVFGPDLATVTIIVDHWFDNHPDSRGDWFEMYQEQLVGTVFHT